MPQQLAGIYHEPFSQVFIGVNNSYDLLDITCCMEILWGYVLGANIQQLLGRYWEGDGGYYGRPLKTDRGETQGYPV